MRISQRLWILAGLTAAICIGYPVGAEVFDRQARQRVVVEGSYKTSPNQTTCSPCSVYGDGGVLSVTNDRRYALKVIDQSSSPVRVANGQACVAFGAGGTGEMIAPGTYDYVGNRAAADGGTTSFLTCCAQTATSSPVGPYLCLTPME